MPQAEHKFTLEQGITFDFSPLWGEGRIQAEDITEFSSELEQAVAGVAQLRKTGLVKGHLSKDGKPEPVYFTRLPYLEKGNPNTEELLKGLTSYGQKTKDQCDVVIFSGIGGSYLGGRVLYDCYTGEYWERTQQPGERLSKIYFTGNSLDVETMESTWGELQLLGEAMRANTGKKMRVALVAISKSGTTLEPTAGFLYFYSKLTAAKEVFKLDVTVVTDKNNHKGPFNVLADKYGWRVFDVLEGIGGRFSVLSTPGLVVAAILGMDLFQLLAGARDLDLACQGSSPEDNPALANALYKYIANVKYGCSIEVIMPYSQRLLSLGDWYVQLLAESLGKRKNRQGEDVFYGRTPTVAVGTTDMHSQTQLHQDGKRDKVVQFLTVAGARNKIVLTNPFPEIKSYAPFAGLDIDRALFVARDAYQEALSSDKRFNACICVPKLNEYVLGQLFYFFMLSIAYEGEMAEVDAYDQPGVEIYKRIMHKNL